MKAIERRLEDLEQATQAQGTQKPDLSLMTDQELKRLAALAVKIKDGELTASERRWLDDLEAAQAARLEVVKERYPMKRLLTADFLANVFEELENLGTL
jgi:hypothetical protein